MTEWEEFVGALRKWAEHMDQWERLSFVDSTGNRVYVNINYYGDGYTYDDLERAPSNIPEHQIQSPGFPKE